MNLSIVNVSKQYRRDLWGLRDFSLELEAGVLGLLGPNGAGKSTLMRILATVTSSTAGVVTWNGVDIAQHPNQLRRVLGYLPQDFGVYPNLNALEFLEYLAAIKGLDGKTAKRRIDELLQLVNLASAARRPLGGYSGGMKQRVGIAQALLNDPQLLIVDEPTAGLDPEERHRFYRVLAELASDRTVLLSTHIVEDVAVLCPRFAVISQGQLVTTTTPSDAKGRLAGKIFEGTGSDEELAELVRDYRVTQAVLVEGKNRVRVHAPTGRAPRGFRPVEPTLEDAYMTLVAPERFTSSEDANGAGPDGAARVEAVIGGEA